MEFIPESLFNSSVGQNFLVEYIYMPIFKPFKEGYNNA